MRTWQERGFCYCIIDCFNNKGEIYFYVICCAQIEPNQVRSYCSPDHVKYRNTVLSKLAFCGNPIKLLRSVFVFVINFKELAFCWIPKLLRLVFVFVINFKRLDCFGEEKKKIVFWLVFENVKFLLHFPSIKNWLPKVWKLCTRQNWDVLGCYVQCLALRFFIEFVYLRQCVWRWRIIQL
jgi:hypothetical protein